MHKRTNKSRKHKKNRYKGGNTDLHKAILQRDINIIKESIDTLLSTGTDINVKDNNDKTPLHFAVLLTKLPIVELLIAKGANINAKDKDGYTPLHYAVKHGKLDIVELLIAKGADPNIKDKDGYTPLHYAQKYDNKDIAQLLIYNGATSNDNSKNTFNGVSNNLEMERIKSISTPGGRFLKDYQRDYPEEYAKKYTPINTPPSNKFLVLGHGCDSGEQFRVPPGCTYYTRATCGLRLEVDEFDESFTTKFIKHNFYKNGVGELKPHTHANYENTKPYSNAYRSNHMYSNTEYSFFSYFPRIIDYYMIDEINTTNGSKIKQFVKDSLMNFTYILPSGIVEYRENRDDFKYNLSIYSLLFDDNNNNTNFDYFFDSIILDDIKILPIMLKYKLDKLLSLKMKDKDFFTDLIMYAYKYSFFPNKDDVMKVYSENRSSITTIEQLEELINEKFSISQVELFQHFKGTYYNIACRNPCKYTNTGRVERRRRTSVFGGKRKKKGTRKRRSG